MTARASKLSPLADAAPIGGFFEQHTPEPGSGPTVLEAWTEGRPYAAFVNARSAFAALVAGFPDAAVWLPAYLCAEMGQAAQARIRFYGVGQAFEPDLSGVEAQARTGDVVLAVSHFGLPFAPGLFDLARRRPDLRFVEDRAQALDAGPGMEGAWRLYSPRKLMGVADGGLLVAPKSGGRVPRPGHLADAEALWTAPRLRAADRAGRDRAVWHLANQAREARMSCTGQAITPQSLSILSAAPLAPLARARMSNWRRLDDRLSGWSALPGAAASPPLGYVLKLEPARRERLLRGLYEARIFAAVHWTSIAAPDAAFPREAHLSQTLVTLPCDHRYGARDMDRIADCVLDLLG
jgi:hypothetical protein